MRLSLFFACCLAWSGATFAGDLRTGFRDAVELNAELRGLVAQHGMIDARRQGTQTLLPGAPSISPSWRTTTFTQRTGFQEFELGGELPLWLPGEARALRSSVEAQYAQLASRKSVCRSQLKFGMPIGFGIQHPPSATRQARAYPPLACWSETLPARLLPARCRGRICCWRPRICAMQTPQYDRLPARPAMRPLPFGP